MGLAVSARHYDKPPDRSTPREKKFAVVNSFGAFTLTGSALLFGSHGQVAHHGESGWQMRLLSSW